MIFSDEKRQIDIFGIIGSPMYKIFCPVLLCFFRDLGASSLFPPSGASSSLLFGFGLVMSVRAQFSIPLLAILALASH